MRFELTGGRHGMEGKNYAKGDKITTDIDLESIWPNKFKRLDTPNVSSGDPNMVVKKSKVMKKSISILCPTWGRPEMAKRFEDSVMRTASRPSSIEILFYIDSDDPCLAEYQATLEGEIVVGPPMRVGAAWNVLAKKCQGDYLMMGNDDLVAITSGWDIVMQKELAQYSDGIFCAWFNDDVNGPKHCAFPIVSRRWYKVVGYFTPECFLFGYNDTWVGDIGTRVGRMHYIESATIEHQHFSTNKTKRDATTERNRDNNQFKKDKITFEEKAPEREADADKLLAAIVPTMNPGAYVPDERLLKTLRGKRVALVGPGGTLVGTKMGAEIDSYDVVCRVNECWSFGYDSDYGNRTDIVFHSFASPTIHNLEKSLKENQFLTEQLSWFIAAQTASNTKDTPLKNLAKLNSVFQKKVHHVGDPFWYFLNKELGRTPNTGFIALCVLLQYPVKELLLTGFSFYKEGSQSDVCHHPAYAEWGGDRFKTDVPSGMHAQEPQMDYLKKVLLPRHGSRLKLDSHLIEVLETKHSNVLDIHPKIKPKRYKRSKPLKALLKGKKVVIVGPSPHLLGKKAGKRLDKYDVVCRVNELYPFGAEKDYGSRTDILFHCCGQLSITKMLKTLKEHPGAMDKIKMVVCPQAESNPHGNMINNWHTAGLDTPFHHIGDPQWRDMSRRVGVAPNTGLLAIILMLEFYNVKELYVTGFSFYAQGVRPEERHSPSYMKWGGDSNNNEEVSAISGQACEYNQTIQKKYFREMGNRNTKLKVDPYLRKLLAAPDKEEAPRHGREHTTFAVYRALYGADSIEASLRSVLNHVDKAFVFWTDTPFGDAKKCTFEGATIIYPEKVDNVVGVVEKLQEEFGGRIVLEYDHWGKPDDQYTHLVNDLIIPRYGKADVFLLMAPDMVWRRDQLQKALKEFLQSGDISATCGQVELWKTFDYRIPERKKRIGPIFWSMRKQDLLPTTGKSGENCRQLARLTAKVHNVGFCAPARMMFWKHLLSLGYGPAIGDSLSNEGWFFDKWVSWDEKKNNIDLEIAAGHESDIPCAKPYDVTKLPEELKV